MNAREVKTMKDRPLPFSAEQVRAVLEDRMTQTRRVINFALNEYHRCNPLNPENDILLGEWGLSGIGELEGNTLHYTAQTEVDDCEKATVTCPYGVPGDRLWVRETFALSIFDPDTAEPDTKNPDDWDRPRYKADGNEKEWHRQEVGEDGLARNVESIKPPWRSSRYMPRWASRISLEVIGVRVERVQDISEVDAQAEISRPLNKTHLNTDGSRSVHPDRIWRDGFRSVWDSINAKRGYGWDVNPWVWIVEFRRLTTG